MSATATDLEARVKALEAAAAAKEHHVLAWIKANWAHYVTWVGLAWQIFGKHL